MARNKPPASEAPRIVKLAETVSEWMGNNYGGPIFPCGFCGHYYDTAVLNGRTEDAMVNRLCPIGGKGKGKRRKVTRTSEIPCPGFSIVTFHFCNAKSEQVHIEVCAFRYFNDVFPECGKCAIGELCVEWVYWNEQDVQEADEVRETITNPDRKRNTNAE